MAKKKVISILGCDDSDNITQRGGESGRGSAYRRGEISGNKLKRRLREFLDGMEDVVRDLPETLGALQLDSVSFSVEVTANGRISLLGSGGEVGGKGGLTFTLKRSELRSAASASEDPASDE